MAETTKLKGKSLLKKKSKIGLTSRRAVYGYIFILPFILGFIFFMIKPLAQSFRMSKRFNHKKDESKNKW